MSMSYQCASYSLITKAFDSVEHCGIINAIKEHQINSVYIETLINIYNSRTLVIRLDKESNKFPIQKGVRQGDTLSPKLFNAGLEQVFRMLNWDNTGITINGEKLNHLTFADDIVLIANNGEEAKVMLNELNRESNKLGMKIYIKNTKVMYNDYTNIIPVHVGTQEVGTVNDYVYLGQLVTMKIDRSDEIKRRIAAGWGACGQYRDILKSKMPLSLKRKVYNQCIQAAMT